MTSVKNKILRSMGISYLKRIIRITKGPVFVSLFFTRNCNFDCLYCAASKTDNNSNISLSKWKSIINELYKQGCRFITIYGGEPTLRSDLGRLLKHCIELKIYTHVVTNGSLLNRDLLEDFASYGYLVLGVGIDSLSQTNFSPKKYRPELMKLLNSIKSKYPDKIDFCFHILTTNYNIKELIPLIKTINNQLECRFSIDPVHSSFNSEDQYQFRSYCPDLLLRKKSMKQLRIAIQNLRRHGIQIWSPNIYYYYMDKWYRQNYLWKCDAGDLYFSINNDGSVMLCEDVNTTIQFFDFIKLSHNKRTKVLKEFKFEYCDCFKPCYWNPSNFVNHPISNFITNFKLK